MWHPLTTDAAKIPRDCDLRLAVIDRTGEVSALVFPSRYRKGFWVNAITGRVLELVPTHWQLWTDSSSSPKPYNGTSETKDAAN
jgi:hypothetical protein